MADADGGGERDQSVVPLHSDVVRPIPSRTGSKRQVSRQYDDQAAR